MWKHARSKAIFLNVSFSKSCLKSHSTRHSIKEYRNRFIQKLQKLPCSNQWNQRGSFYNFLDKPIFQSKFFKKRTLVKSTVKNVMSFSRVFMVSHTLLALLEEGIFYVRTKRKIFIVTLLPLGYIWIYKTAIVVNNY